MKMEKLDAMLAKWRSIEPQQVPIGTIGTDDTYQARNVTLAPYDERGRLEIESAKHIADLTAKLEDGRDLDPLLVARIDGALWLIDGHHRLAAYKKAAREHIPARIRECSKGRAVLISKAVNCDGVKLPMHREQRKEGAWQLLAIITERGNQELPKGYSLRGIARHFGIAADTISRMKRRMYTVNQTQFTDEACDPGTGWPQWIHVRGNAIRDNFKEIPINKMEEHKAQRLAIRLGEMLEKHGEERFIKALRLLTEDSIAESVDAYEQARHNQRKAEQELANTSPANDEEGDY